MKLMFQITDDDRRVLNKALEQQTDGDMASLRDVEEFIRMIVRDNFTHLHQEHDPPPPVMRIKRRVQ